MISVLSLQRLADLGPVPCGDSSVSCRSDVSCPSYFSSVTEFGNGM